MILFPMAAQTHHPALLGVGAYRPSRSVGNDEVAGPIGRDASAATDIQMRAQILSYSRARGLFAGITLEGATFSQDRDANERFYGTAYRTSQIIFDRLGGAPTPVSEWRNALGKYAK